MPCGGGPLCSAGGMHQKMELRSTGKGQTKCEATQQAQGPSQLRKVHPVTAGAQWTLLHSHNLTLLIWQLGGWSHSIMQTENYGREWQLRVFVGPDGAANKPMKSKYMHKASPYKAGTQWVHKMLVSPSHPHPRADLREQMALEALKNK